jgi:hypothetical protein
MKYQVLLCLRTGEVVGTSSGEGDSLESVCTHIKRIYRSAMRDNLYAIVVCNAYGKTVKLTQFSEAYVKHTLNYAYPDATTLKRCEVCGAEPGKPCINTVTGLAFPNNDVHAFGWRR